MKLSCSLVLVLDMESRIPEPRTGKIGTVAHRKREIEITQT